MKNSHYIFLIFIFVNIMSCSTESNNSAIEHIKPRSVVTDYKIVGGMGYVVLLQKNYNSDNDIYILFTHSNREFQQNLQVRSIRQIPNGIEVDLETGPVMRWSIGIDADAAFTGYGLSKVSGNYYYPYFYGHGGPLQDPDVEEVSCKCKANIDRANCDHGGKGSTECSIEHGGTLVGSGIQMKCAVKCETGYYACCKNI